MSHKVKSKRIYNVLSALSGRFRRMRVLYMNVPRRDTYSPIKVVHFFYHLSTLVQIKAIDESKKGSSKYCTLLMHIECSLNAS